MKELEKLIETVKNMIDKTAEDIRNGEPLLKDQILHQFYEGKVPALRKKKQELMRILKELEEIAEKLVNSTEEDDEDGEETEEDDFEEVSKM